MLSSALDAETAQNTGNYRITQRIDKKKIKVVPILSASYIPGTDSVTLSLGRSQKGKSLQLTITGLRASNQMPLSESIVEL